MRYIACLLLCASSVCGLPQVVANQEEGATPASSQDGAQFAALYASWDAAVENGRFEDVLNLASPDATLERGSSKLPLRDVIAQMKTILQAGARATQKTSITSIHVAGPQARVSTRTQSIHL